MGTWGCLPFENDEAGDWVYSLEDAEDFSFIDETLECVTDEDGANDAAACSEAIAAAEVVAALHGAPRLDLPESVSNWVEGRGAVPRSIVAKARRAVDAILTESELLELWKESEEYAVWRNAVEDLKRRLE